MRNGNNGNLKIIKSRHPRSYPTYEEWKQEVLFNVTDPELFVLILPMRNGNTIEETEKHTGFKFLSYL